MAQLSTLGSIRVMAYSLPAWQAQFEGRSLHISGTVKFPDDFSVASLERTAAPPELDMIAYRVVFHRDKEHFCGPDLIGTLHYFVQHLPVGVARIRVLFDGGQVEIPIPKV